MSAKKHLEALLAADRELREAEARLLAVEERGEVSLALKKAAQEAFDLADERESCARLIRLSDLAAQVQGLEMAELLVRVLGHHDPQVRLAAGEALRDFAYDRYAEVAKAIERAYDRGEPSLALEEIPWILAEIAEPSAVPLIGRALRHADPAVVAAGIEALTELGDPSAAPLLKPLLKDRRVTELEDGEASYSTSIAELAQEALEALEE